MKRWPTISLGELCDVRIGRTPRRDEPRFWGGNAVWITVGELNGGTITSSKEQVSDIAVRECMPEPVPAGTLLFSFKLSIGKMAITGCPLYTNEAIAALPIRNSNKLSRDFLRYALMSESREDGADTAVLGKLLNKEKVQHISIPIPPLAEQERIVKLLDEADELRSLRAQAARRTAALTPALFHEMFGDPAVNPRRCKLKAISEIADVQGGLQLTPLRDTYSLKRPYLRVANVQRGFLVLTEIKEIGLLDSEFERTKLSKGDLLLVEGNGNPKEVGRAAIWDGSVADCVHQNHLIRVRPRGDLLTSDYLLAFVNSESGQSYFHGSGNTTSGLATISTSIVKHCRIPVPPPQLQEEFAQRVSEIHELEVGQSTSRARLDALFHSMLHRAFNGEL